MRITDGLLTEEIPDSRVGICGYVENLVIIGVASHGERQETSIFIDFSPTSCYKTRRRVNVYALIALTHAIMLIQLLSFFSHPL